MTLTKEDTAGDTYDSYTLYANGNGNSSNTSSVAGGVVAQARGTTTIDGCKAFVKKMYQGTSGKEAFRGWIVGYAEDETGCNITINDCAIGGACASAPVVTLSAANFEDSYLYGSKGEKATVKVTGDNSYWDAGDAPAGNTVVEIVISDYAEAHSWGASSPSNYQSTVTQGDITLTASAKPNKSNGAYCPDWRFYQARGGGLTISVDAPHALVGAKFTYTITNTAIMIAPDGTTQVSSDTWCPLSGSSSMFTVGNTAEATDGQVRITKIVIEYE